MVRLLLYLIDLILFLMLGWVLRRTVQLLFARPRIHFWSSRTMPPPGGPAQSKQGEMARDPVCGMFVSTELSYQLKQGGQTIHFCSRECLEGFQKSATNP